MPDRIACEDALNIARDGVTIGASFDALAAFVMSTLENPSGGVIVFSPGGSESLKMVAVTPSSWGRHDLGNLVLDVEHARSIAAALLWAADAAERDMAIAIAARRQRTDMVEP